MTERARPTRPRDPESGDEGNTELDDAESVDASKDVEEVDSIAPTRVERRVTAREWAMERAKKVSEVSGTLPPIARAGPPPALAGDDELGPDSEDDIPTEAAPGLHASSPPPGGSRADPASSFPPPAPAAPDPAADADADAPSTATPTSVTTGASRVTGSTSSPYTAVRTTSFASPIETLKLEEVRRTRAFTMVALPCSLIVLAVLMVLPGDPVGRWAGGAGMFCIAASSIAVRIMLRRDEGYRLGPVLVFGYACVAGAYGAIYFFGAFSPAVAIIPFGLYFFSLSQSFRATLSVTVSCMVLQAALGFGTTFGVLTDHGLIQGGELGVTARVVIVLLVEMVFIATFLVARAGRGAMVQALEVHDRDLRALAQREALLKEARQELERALVAGGLGRFSDQELGSFKLGRVIGRGGMGEVYEASHQKTGAGAAVKLLHSPATTDGGVLRRFMREAQIASKLRSPNVVEVLEVGGTEAAMPYIAMELLEGSDLADLLRKHRRLSMHRVLQLSDEVARGLEAARAEGIVHRDLKPRNLFLVDRKDRKPVWKILDFGVSKLVDTQGTLTRDHLVGTPSYMAPEQASGGKVDHRADLYALGVICYRSLTGRPAFPGDGIPDILYKVLHTMPPRPSELVRVSGDVDLVLAVAMAKRPEDRFETALELAQALRLAHEGRLPRETRERGMAAEDASPWGETRG